MVTNPYLQNYTLLTIADIDRLWLDLNTGRFIDWALVTDADVDLLMSEMPDWAVNFVEATVAPPSYNVGLAGFTGGYTSAADVEMDWGLPTGSVTKFIDNNADTQFNVSVQVELLSSQLTGSAVNKVFSTTIYNLGYRALFNCSALTFIGLTNLVGIAEEALANTALSGAFDFLTVEIVGERVVAGSGDITSLSFPILDSLHNDAFDGWAASGKTLIVPNSFTNHPAIISAQNAGVNVVFV